MNASLYRGRRRKDTLLLVVAAVMILNTLIAPSIATAKSAEIALTLEGTDYAIPAIFRAPNGDTPSPAVLMLHGTASQKDEVGGLYRMLAEELAAEGITSLRVDFAGTGDSPVDYRHYTLSSATQDARTAMAWLRAHPRVHGQQIAVIGFSQGGLIAQRLVAAEPAVGALVTWSTSAADGAGSFGDFFARYYGEARTQGFAEVAFDWLPQPLRFDLQWFEEMRAQQTLSAMADVDLPILAIAGLADDTVPYVQSVDLIRQSPNARSRAVLLGGADHVFNVLDAAQGSPGDGNSPHRQLLDITVTWLSAQLLPNKHQGP